MHAKELATKRTKAQLKLAIERREFELYYQPLFDTGESSFYGVEALLRWNHPEKGMLSPASFIPLAEETGLIVGLGSWVLHQACSDFAVLEAASNEDLCLSVNVSSRQLEEPDFIMDLAGVLAESDIAPNLLQLELTESIFLRDPVYTGETLRRIRSMGVKIAFDDFGTGYSSLSYLEKYPIDTLKIDQSFVQKIGNGTVNSQIVKMIVDLAKALEMEVSAEGVEKEEQALVLKGYGCTRVQGYLYGRPMSLPMMRELLLKRSTSMLHGMYRF